jgi:hypothetical protein
MKAEGGKFSAFLLPTSSFQKTGHKKGQAEISKVKNSSACRYHSFTCIHRIVGGFVKQLSGLCCLVDNLQKLSPPGLTTPSTASKFSGLYAHVSTP